MRELETRFLGLSSRDGYRELGLSALTLRSELEKTSGASSDVVTKELVDLDDEVFAPEGTPQVLSYAFDNPGRYSYVAPMMRGERVQRGRLREFNQLGVEDVTTRPVDPLQAVASIELMLDVLEGYDVSLRLGYLGCAEDQERLRVALERAYPGCRDCCKRQEVNPIRMLDCKVCDKSDLPTFDMVGCGPCRAKRDLILSLLPGTTWDPWLVRGLDYYTGPVWEAVSDGLAVGGGGMYRAEVGRKNTARVLNGVGWAVGLERLLLQTPSPPAPEASRAVAVMASTLPGVEVARRAGRGRLALYGTLKECLRRADQLGCSDILIVGDREIEAGQGVLKDLTTGAQSLVAL